MVNDVKAFIDKITLGITDEEVPLGSSTAIRYLVNLGMGQAPFARERCDTTRTTRSRKAAELPNAFNR
jgi:hypothetical protein